MQTIQISSSPQGEILGKYRSDPNRCVFIMGPLGSGKTVESCQKIFRKMCAQQPNNENVRPTRFIAVRNTFPDLSNTTIKDWLELYGDLGKYSQGGIDPPNQKLDFELEDGTIVKSEIIFLALDRDDAVKKLRGMQVTGFWLNEVKELPKSIVDMADLRHGRYPTMANSGVKCSWHGMIGDYNAPDEDHWLYKLAEEEKPEGWVFYRQPGGLLRIGEKYIENADAENLPNLPEGYYTRGQAGKAPEWINVNLCNEYGFVTNGKPVYPEYVDSVHCLEDFTPDRQYPITMGIDFGRTPACSFLQYNASIGRWVAFDEFLAVDMGASSFAPELKKYIDHNYPDFTFARGGGDPSGMNKGQATDDVAYQILRKHGISTVYPVWSNKTSIRRAAMTSCLTRLCMDGKPAFMVTPRAKTLRKALMGGFCMRRIQVSGERYADEPEKNDYSHIAEACEYGLMAGGEGRKAIRADRNYSEPRVMKDFDVF